MHFILKWSKWPNGEPRAKARSTDSRCTVRHLEHRLTHTVPRGKKLHPQHCQHRLEHRRFCHVTSLILPSPASRRAMVGPPLAYSAKVLPPPSAGTLHHQRGLAERPQHIGSHGHSKQVQGPNPRRWRSNHFAWEPAGLLAFIWIVSSRLNQCNNYCKGFPLFEGPFSFLPCGPLSERMTVLPTS